VLLYKVEAAAVPQTTRDHKEAQALGLETKADRISVGFAVDQVGSEHKPIQPAQYAAAPPTICCMARCILVVGTAKPIFPLVPNGSEQGGAVAHTSGARLTKDPAKR